MRIFQILPLGHWILNIYFPPPHTQSLHEEAVATLCFEKHWWCELCKRPATDWPNSIYKLCILSINQLISCLFNYYPQIKFIWIWCVCFSIRSLPPDISQIQTCNVRENMYLHSKAEWHASHDNCLHVPMCFLFDPYLPGTDLQRTWEYVLT